MTAAAHDLMTIASLTVDYRQQGQWRHVIRDLSLAIHRGEILGLAGESGCGKSTLASVLLGERRGERRLQAGSVQFDGLDLSTLRPRELRRLRGRRLALVPQNGGASLTPTLRIGSLFVETLRAHRPQLNNAELAAEARRQLGQVGLPDPTGALARFPHQFSGGQQQRIALALALCRMPDLLILDEPTTGQDAMTRRGIIDLLIRLRLSSRMSMLYVSHDLATLSEICDRIAIMHAGEIVEVGQMEDVLLRPRHPHTRALVASIPRLEAPPDPALLPASRRTPERIPA
jgi:peptide/nickel transport system ATP-binding protein